MWKLVNLFARKLPKSAWQPTVRKYLTSAFNCDEAWNKRLTSPYIKKIKVSDLFFEIENQFTHFGKANGIDIDLFTNAVTDAGHLDEVEDVIHKLRLSSEATSLLDSTQHAFIRLLNMFSSTDELIRILDDRYNYGVFMDDYTCIFLMNKFLVESKYNYAARVATINMLQEDFSHPVVKYMSLFSCHKYLLDPVPWSTEQPEPEKANDDEDEDEEVRLRVRYIRNPFFDDHFDLKNPSHLIGKTCWMIGNELPDLLGHSYSLIGYAMHEKWGKLKELIKSFLQSKDKPVAHKDSVILVRNFIEDISKNENVENDFTDHKEEIINILSQLEDSDLLCEEDFLKACEGKMKEAVTKFESITIETQIKKYEEWEKERQELLNNHIEELKREKALAEIEAAKKEITEKEKELFFFENEHLLDMQIENKRVRYPKKWLGKKKPKRVIDQEYIPPEVEKRREN